MEWLLLSPANLVNLISFLFWSSLYLLIKGYTPEQSPEYHSRAVTLLHGSVATVVGLAQCDIGTLKLCRFTTPIDVRQYALMVWSWGYFAFDLLWCVLYWTESALILTHHLCALISITVYMHKEETGCTFACTLALMEVTNPILQTRWFLRNMGFDKTIFYHIVEVTYLISFLVLRGIVGTYLMLLTLTYDIFGMDQKIIGIALYLISVGLMWEIISYVLYKYKNNIVRGWRYRSWPVKKLAWKIQEFLGRNGYHFERSDVKAT